MNYLHYEVDLGPEDAVEVELDKQANVMLLDDANYRLYQRGWTYRGYRFHVQFSPIQIRPPRAGHWNIVIDLGGDSGTIRARVGVLRTASATN